MYSFQSRVRYSESDQTGHLPLQGILDYFQDSSTFHSEDLGVGVEYLMKHQLLWVLSAWQIVVERYPKMGEEIKIVTFPYEFKGFLGYRNFYMEDSAGEKIAYANSIWTLMNIEQGKPMRPLPEMIEKYVLEERLTMDYAPRKIEAGERGEKGEEIEIKHHHLDSNNHVNNGQYIRIALDSIKKEQNFTQMRATYSKSAVLNDVLVPYVKNEDRKYIVELCNRNGELFAVVELSI